MRFQVVALLQTALCGVAVAHSHHHERTFSAAELEELENKWGTDCAGFSGISTFAHLPHVKCLTQPNTQFDIGIIGAPFDTAVSYRPGARFGPRAIRAASARQTALRGYNPRANLNPYTSWASILDCGDIPVSPFDNNLALRQMSEAFVELSTRSASTANLNSTANYLQVPKLLTLGGDHSIALPALRALNRKYGKPIAVVHFDAHLDTWHPAKYPSYWLNLDDPETQSFFTHGNMFWLASTEGLIANGSSIHAGLRTRLSGEADYEDDNEQGWGRIATDDIDDIGVKGVVQRILSQVPEDYPVYLSIDIDVIDPGLAPGTGTPEPGGWTTRELIRILRGIESLNIVGADVVEVSPAYDGATEGTALAAAQVGYEILTSMVRRGLMEQARMGNAVSSAASAAGSAAASATDAAYDAARAATDAAYASTYSASSAVSGASSAASSTATSVISAAYDSARAATDAAYASAYSVRDKASSVAPYDSARAATDAAYASAYSAASKASSAATAATDAVYDGASSVSSAASSATDAAAASASSLNGKAAASASSASKAAMGSTAVTDALSSSASSASSAASASASSASSKAGGAVGAATESAKSVVGASTSTKGGVASSVSEAIDKATESVKDEL
ncbi:hypothetical protein H2203_001274 [Taxawa tesnikishii (nom. ined.)]|nr:hypothetical protein H2203_001274 [Dothideales sp. JES 119]